jgi:hypothetical protein
MFQWVYDLTKNSELSWLNALNDGKSVLHRMDSRWRILQRVQETLSCAIFKKKKIRVNPANSMQHGVCQTCAAGFKSQSGHFSRADVYWICYL